MSKWGYGPFSNWVSILASADPYRLNQAPTTQNSGVNILISWPYPDDRGSAILAYEIVVLSIDNVTFSQAAQFCNGSNPTVVSMRSC